MRTEIVYEDAQLLVVYKPAGLATQTARVGQQDMVSELKNYLKNPYLAVVHRLDQPVEGLLVVAKDPKTAAALTKQLTAGSLNKRYLAVVCGQPGQTEGQLVDNLYQDANHCAQIVEAQESERAGKGKDRGGSPQKIQKAVLQYRLVETLSTQEPISLMDIHIDTGRFHQIRAQMAHAGCPLLGDTKYGTEASMALSRSLNVRNVALCAASLEFRHPVSGKACVYTIEPKGVIFARFAKYTA